MANFLCGKCFPLLLQGQVPPYAMPQIKGFAVQDGILKTIEATAAAYGLKSIPGSDGEVTVLEVSQIMDFLGVICIIAARVLQSNF